MELTSTTSELAKLKFELNFYTYAEGVYTLFDDTVVGLDVTIRFSTPITKNVGRYNMEANAATSENYSNIKLGKKGDIFCYVFQITPKKLTLKFNDNDFQDNSDGTKSYVKKFTNRQAEYRFGEQESINLLDGLVEGDNFVLILRMYREAGVLAQYVNSGNDYTFAGEISGQNRNNYDFDYSYVLVGNKQVNIRGARIIPTNLYVRVQNMNFIYGDVKSGQDLGVDYFVDDSIYDFSNLLHLVEIFQIQFLLPVS